MLAARYGFDQPTSAAIRREAEQAEAAAQDTVQFTRLIKDAVPYEDRIGVVEALWRIAVTDGINADEQPSCASPPTCSASPTRTAALPASAFSARRDRTRSHRQRGFESGARG